MERQAESREEVEIKLTVSWGTNSGDICHMYTHWLRMGVSSGCSDIRISRYDIYCDIKRVLEEKNCIWRTSYAHSRDKGRLLWQGCWTRRNTGSVCFLFLVSRGNRNTSTHQAMNSLWYLRFQLSSPEPPSTFATLTPLGTMGSCGSMVNVVPTSFHFALRQLNKRTLFARRSSYLRPSDVCHNIVLHP